MCGAFRPLCSLKLKYLMLQLFQRWHKHQWLARSYFHCLSVLTFSIYHLSQFLAVHHLGVVVRGDIAKQNIIDYIV